MSHMDGPGPRVPGLAYQPDKAILRVEELRKTFPVGGGGLMWRRYDQVLAVDGVSFDIARGETFGLVGESGCGKSTIARCLLRLIEPTSGSITFDGIDLLGLDPHALRRLRRRIQIVFQDTAGSLGSRMSVRSIVEEPLVIHGIGTAPERRARVDEMLNLVGIRPETASRKPHQFSGGQRQRIGVVRALILRPELVVLDEPISALDVSVRAQILNLLRDMQERFALTYLFIVHDLTVAEYFCDRLAVLYLGRIMELADSARLFRGPLHPYTVSLLSAVPLPSRVAAQRRGRIVLRGEVSALRADAARGCPFQPRCPLGRDRERCINEAPPLEHKGQGHWVACHFPGELSAPEAENAAHAARPS
jgi:oligopeptide/dipeptide ABC transporter ATP-binding protein